MESNFALSMSALLLLSVCVAAIGIAGTWFLMRSKLDQQAALCAQRETDLREAQKATYEMERGFLEERNRIELVHAEAVQRVKAEAHEQGRQLGLVEGESRHLQEFMALKTEFSAKLASEIDAAVADTKRRVAAEYELQTKLFSVQISPLVRITEDKGLLSSSSQVETGYQYQLLVNGIPAFQPHAIVERSEVKKEVNEQNIRELTALAKDFANNAIDTYLGAGGGKFAKLASVIVKKLPKL